jgi:hypothetical protein
MDSVNLNAGWLERQIKATQEEVKSWPDCFRTSTIAEANAQTECGREARPKQVASITVDETQR